MFGTHSGGSGRKEEREETGGRRRKREKGKAEGRGRGRRESEGDRKEGEKSGKERERKREEGLESMDERGKREGERKKGRKAEPNRPTGRVQETTRDIRIKANDARTPRDQKPVPTHSLATSTNVSGRFCFPFPFVLFIFPLRFFFANLKESFLQTTRLQHVDIDNTKRNSGEVF